MEDETQNLHHAPVILTQMFCPVTNKLSLLGKRLHRKKKSDETEVKEGSAIETDDTFATHSSKRAKIEVLNCINMKEVEEPRDKLNVRSLELNEQVQSRRVVDGTQKHPSPHVLLDQNTDFLITLKNIVDQKSDENADTVIEAGHQAPLFGTAAKEDTDWWSLEDKIIDFLDSEGVYVVPPSDARIKFFGSFATYFQTPITRESAISFQTSNQTDYKKHNWNSARAQNHTKSQHKLALNTKLQLLSKDSRTMSPDQMGPEELQVSRQQLKIAVKVDRFSLDLSNNSLFKSRRLARVSKAPLASAQILGLKKPISASLLN